jgi:hypothetical protein
MRGAQYLHRPIPGLSTQSFQIDYRLEGPIDGYREKVYGDMSDVQVSPETMTGIAEAWDIREAYDAAWAEYSPLIRSWEMRGVNDLASIIHGNYDKIISTIPARSLCWRPEHTFESQIIWSTDYVKHIGVFEETEGEPIADNIVICSGYEDDWWYRQSRIHGWENTEFPLEYRPSGESFRVEKPVRTDCDCWQGIMRLGRYGAWKKGVLSDASFYDVEDMLIDEMEGRAYVAQ